MTVTPVSAPPVIGVGSVRLPGRPRLVDAPAITTVPGSQYAFLGMTARVVDRVLRAPSRPEDPIALARAIDDAVLAVRSGLVARARAVTEVAARADLPPRAEVVRAHGASARYLRRWLPAAATGLHYAGVEVAAATRADLPGELARLASATWPRGRRLAWAVDADEWAAGLLLDRLSPTHLPEQAYTAWMAQQVHADLRLGHHLAGDGFLGVRVLLPLAPAASLHVTAAGERHGLGDCASCTTDPMPLPDRA
jgi:hypothetical protein